MRERVSKVRETVREQERGGGSYRDIDGAAIAVAELWGSKKILMEPSVSSRQHP